MNKPKQKRIIRARWLWILMIQLISMLALGALISLSVIPGKIFHGICLWGVMPICGFVSACLATKKGLLNYAAWIAPPVMEVFGNLLVWGYSPTMGPVFLCAFISLVGAATGEVLKRQYKR